MIALVSSHSVDLITVCETWLNDNTPSNLLEIDGYYLLRKDRKNKKGGGVCAWIRKELRPEFIQFEEPGVDIDICSAYIHSSKFIMVLLYIPPNINSETFVIYKDYLLSTVDKALLNHATYDLIILGDFNRHDISVFTVDLDATNKVKCNTRGDAILDYIFMTDNISAEYKDADVGNPIGRSDHRTIICEPSNMTIKPDSTFKTYRDFSVANIEMAKIKLAQTNWNTLYQTTDVDEKLKIFYKILDDSISHIPQINVFIKNEDKPWMTTSIKYKILQRWTAYKTNNFIFYNTLKRDIKEEIKNAKKRWADSIKTKSKSIWTIVNSLNGKSAKRSTPFQDKENAIELLQHSFQSVFSCSSNYDTCTDRDSLPSADSLSTVEEIHKLLSNVQSKKCFGPDNIPNMFYKKAADFLCQPLCHIYNQCIQTGKFPSLWKQSIIVPIPKTTPATIEQVRPISLLSLPSKIFERVIIRPIKNDMERMFGASQFGYKSFSSAECALLAVQERIIRELDKTTTKNVLVVTLDFSKAFDRVHHDTLLKKLKPLPKDRHEIIKSYLQNRTFKVKIGSKISVRSSDVISSVPQGSVIGPLLWCIYCSDLHISNNSIQTFKYADDTTFVITIDKDEPEPATKLLNTISLAENWCITNSMLLNSSKTKILNISFSPTAWQPSLELQNKYNFVVTLRLLGVTFNNKMNFKDHIDNVVKTCAKRMTALRMLQDILTEKELRHLFEMTIKPVCLYGCSLFFRMPANIKNKIHRIFIRSHKIFCKNCVCNINIDEIMNANSHKLFFKIHSNSRHILSSLLPNFNPSSNRYILHSNRTSKAVNSFFNFNAITFNNIHTY